MRLLIALVIAFVIGFGHTADAKHHRHRHHVTHHVTHHAQSYGGTKVLPHPEGCPRTAFCGCGASIEVFHRNIRRLWLAREWYSFPRSEPAPGMAIVRPHHVAILKEHIQGSVWMVIDHNGGHHQSYLHPRSIAGYTVVNPHGETNVASNATPKDKVHITHHHRTHRVHTVHRGMGIRLVHAHYAHHRHIRSLTPVSYFDLTHWR